VIKHFGTVPWTDDDMRGKLEEFAAIYDRRPLPHNPGGMSSTHCFLFWFVLQYLKPTVVVESGVWRGQGTWFIEQACPEAVIYCIDLDWSNLRYSSKHATYLDHDFEAHDWSLLPKEDTVLFFDDHVDAFQRAKAVHAMGFRHALFEDNYPYRKGDCYSLKEVMEETGHHAYRNPRALISRLRGRLNDKNIPPNAEHAAELRRIADAYVELPPIFKPAQTRWGDAWDDRFPTPAPLLKHITHAYQRRYYEEAAWYTWMGYLRLKRA
jgi:hypothetical protein